MILTESDLHAYNRGELSAEATRLLESDPLAMEDAARLRAISAALRAEATIPVTGRAETLERLRARNAKGIGVPKWVWGVGVACVAGAIAVSLPSQAIPGFRIQRVVYSVPEGSSDLRPLSTGGVSSDAASSGAGAGRPMSAAAGTPRTEAQGTAEEAAASAARLAPPSVARSRAQSQSETTPPSKATITLQVPDLASEGRRVSTEIQTLGGRIVSDRTQSRSRTIQTSLDPSKVEILRDRLAPQTEIRPRPLPSKGLVQEKPASYPGEGRSSQAKVATPQPPSTASTDSAKVFGTIPSSSSGLPHLPKSTVEITLTRPPSAPVAPLLAPSPRDFPRELGVLASIAVVVGGAWALRLRSRRRRS